MSYLAKTYAFFGIGLATLVGICAAPSAQAATISLEAVDDNYGLRSQATTVQGSSGTSSTMLVKRDSGTNLRKAWNKFDLSAANPDDTMGFTFDFRSTSNSTNYTGTFGIWALNTGFVPPGGVLGTNWSEGDLTWNNGPANITGTGGGFNASATKLGTIDFDTGAEPAGTVYSISSATPLSNFLQADGTVTLMIDVDSQSNSSPAFNLASSEHLTLAGPTLTFSQIPVPEPSTLLILATGLLGLLVKRRRR